MTMIDRSKIMVLTPALFDNLDPIWMLVHTAQVHNVPLRPYGCEPGVVYRGWIDVKVHRLLAELDKLEQEGFTHMLYMDGRDTMWVGPFDEVLEKYERYGNPKLLMSCQPTVFESYREYYNLDLYPTKEQVGEFNLPASPLFMGEVQYIAACLQYMLRWPDVATMPDDDPAWWRRFDNEQHEELKNGHIVYDHKCMIFQNAGELVQGKSQWEHVLKFETPSNGKLQRRLYNTLTYKHPCVLHFDGGYSHALYGKWDRLERFWKIFGYQEVRPPWEKK